MAQPQPQITRESSTYLTDPQAAQLCEIFAQGLETGLSYARILKFLERKGLGEEVVSNLRTALLEDGLRLSEAFAKYGILDINARKLIFVAEDQGTLPRVFEQQILIYRDRYARRKKTLSAFAEPALIMILGFGLLMPILSNVVKIFNMSNKVMGVIGAITVPLLCSIIGVCIFGALCYAWLNSPVESSFGKTLDRAWMHIPIISRPKHFYNQYVMCRYCAMSIQSGMNIFDSIELAIEATNDSRLSAYTERVLDAIERGDTLEDAFSIIPILEEDIIDYIAIGEETGRLSPMLEEVSDILKERAQELFTQYMNGFIFFFRLALIFTVGGVAVYNGLFKSLMPEFAKVLKEANVDGGY